MSGSSGYTLEVVGFVRVCEVRWGALWWSLVHFRLSGSTDCALAVAGFVQVRLVCPGMLLWPLSSFGIVWLVRVCLRVAGFFLVLPCTYWVLLSSYAFVKFVLVRFRGCWVGFGSSFWFVHVRMGVARFVRVRPSAT